MDEIYSAIISKRCRERFLTESTAGRRALQQVYLGSYGCGISELRMPYRIERRYPATHAVLFTLRGSGCLKAPALEAKLTAGTACVLPAGQDHCFGTNGSWHLLWFHTNANAFWTELMPATASIIPALWAGRLAVLAEEFLQETTRRGRPAHANILAGYAHLIALFLRRELNIAERSGDAVHRHRLEALWQVIAEAPGQKWTIGRLAHLLHFSRSHLQAVTHRIYGHGAMEMVARVRMERAATLVLNRQLKLADISEQVGYESPFSFSRAFKRVMGVAPEEYRAVD